MTNDEKLHLLVQRVADLQAQCAALEYFTTDILVPVLLNTVSKEAAIQILNAARISNVRTLVEAGLDDQGDAQVMGLKVEEAIQALIDKAERMVRR